MSGTRVDDSANLDCGDRDAQCEPYTLVGTAIALLGGWAHLDVVAAVCELTLAQAVAVASQLERAGVIVGAEPATFVDEHARAACTAAVPAPVRAVMHARIAEQLRRRGAADEEVCAHLLRSPGDRVPANVQILRRHARVLLRAGRPADAVLQLERALREPPSEAELPELLLELADALLAQHRHSNALEAATRARERASTVHRRAEAEMRIFAARVGMGHVERALAALEREIEAVEPEDPDLALRLERELLRHGATDGRVFKAGLRHYGQRSVDNSLPAAADYLLTVGQLLAMGGSSTAQEAVATVGRGLEMHAGEREDLEPVLRSLWLLVRADEHAYAQTVIERARSRTSERGEQPALDAMQGLLTLRWGSVETAVRELRDALAMARRQHDALAIALALAFLAHALHEAGESGPLQRLLSENDPDNQPASAWTAILRVARGRHLLEAGRPKDALDDLMTVERCKVELGLTNPAGFHQAEPAVEALLTLGEHARALELARLNLDRAQAWGAPMTVALARGALARCLPPREGIAEMAQALALLPDAHPTVTRARLLLDSGRILVDASRPRAARTTLREALDVASRVDAARIAGHSRMGLNALGARPRRPHAHGVLSLTLAEQRVAALAATGISNRQIAAQLYLSVRTVENHLRRVYSKLATDRTGLADVLRGEAPSSDRSSSLTRPRDR